MSFLGDFQYAASGIIGCLNIWDASFDYGLLSEAASCNLEGNIFSLSKNTEHLGSMIGEHIMHPDYRPEVGEYMKQNSH